MNNAVIYCRSSSEGQNTGGSLASQELACKAYCQQKGLAVDSIHVEKGSSPATERRGFRALLRQCRKRKNSIQYIIVQSSDRLTRNIADYHALVGCLRRYGISIRSVTHDLKSTPAEKLIADVVAAFMEFDQAQRSERIRMGMMAAKMKKLGKNTNQGKPDQQ